MAQMQQQQFFSEHEMGGAKHDFMFKLVLIGDTEVGKSQLLLRYTKDQFKRQTPSTIGMEFAMQAVQIQDAVIRAQIWDTAGQERYRAITNTYYRQAIGVLLVYDISRRTSFENLDKWLSEVRDHGDEKVEVILVGNKSDLEKTRQVSKEEAQKYADDHNISFVESSALNASNVETAFTKLIGTIYQKLNEGEYQDRLEQFNYFGSEKIRQQYLEQAMLQSLNDSKLDETSTSTHKGRERKRVVRGPNGELQQMGRNPNVRLRQSNSTSYIDEENTGSTKKQGCCGTL